MLNLFIFDLAVLNKDGYVLIAANEIVYATVNAVSKAKSLGKQGSLIHKSNTITKIQPVLTDSELDATGAGDIFATAFTLSLKYGERQAGNLAAAYATSSIEQIGPMPLPSQKIIRKRVLDEPRSFDHNHQGD